MNKTTTIILATLTTLALIGCGENSLKPNFNRNNIGGEINPKSTIPLCGKGTKAKWVAQSTVREPKLIDGKLFTHNKGFGIEQRICKKPNGNILVFMVEKEINEMKAIH